MRRPRRRSSPRAGLLAAAACVSCTAVAPLATGPSAPTPPAPTAALGAPDSTIRVELTQRPESGRIRLLLFDSNENFQDLREAARIETFDAGEELVLANVPPGEYALLVHFDEDDDGELDRNLLGIPVEPIAFSNGYRPTGPPTYARARFELDDEAARAFELSLARPLGERGLWSVGLGVIGRSSPYVDYDGGVLQPIPVVTYNGERLQVLGPFLSYGIAGSDRLRLAATARYRIGAYEESESPALTGLGDRDATAMAGLRLVYELPNGIDVQVGYEHDVLDQVGGGTGRFSIDRPFQLGVASLSPRLGLQWTDADVSNYDFGVPAELALPERPAYAPASTLNTELGVGAFVEITERWRLVADLGVQLLDDDIEASPIVDDDVLLQGFLAVTYSP